MLQYSYSDSVTMFKRVLSSQLTEFKLSWKMLKICQVRLWITNGGRQNWSALLTACIFNWSPCLFLFLFLFQRLPFLIGMFLQWTFRRFLPFVVVTGGSGENTVYNRLLFVLLPEIVQRWSLPKDSKPSLTAHGKHFSVIVFDDTMSEWELAIPVSYTAYKLHWIKFLKIY